MKKLVLLFLLVSSYVFAQNINDYRYVIVSPKFEFQNSEDQYRLNTLTKMMFEKYGFVVYIGTKNIPVELYNRRCSLLYADVVSLGGMLSTKLKVQLKDCEEKIIFETQVGTSKEKSYDRAYTEALRNASESLDRVKYNFNGKNDISEPIAKEETEPIVEEKTQQNNPEIFFFAQPIANGFQIVNNEPRVIMRLFNTSQKNVFIAVKGDVHGVMLNKNGKWFFEFYESGKLTSEMINLRF
jgi:hypothetical protein